MQQGALGGPRAQVGIAGWWDESSPAVIIAVISAVIVTVIAAVIVAIIAAGVAALVAAFT